MQLRPAQEAILQYQGGRMAVSAVPGSGKTTTLALLAAELLAGGRINVDNGQQVLIVTYLNSSVETFRARIRRRLLELERPLLGFDVRTLHSLALEIVRVVSSGAADAPNVLDELQSANLLARAVDSWIEAHPDLWRAFLPDDTPQLRARWHNVTEKTARAFIRAAKNQRYRPEAIQSRCAAEANAQLLWMMGGVYQKYQSLLLHQGALDFDDLIWQAADLLEYRPDLAESLRQQWPYVLEDEAQDSVPLQEVLLTHLTGPLGNWVRVGDPNQAITSTFTAADPRYFNAFLDRPEVTARPLPNSGRCAPLIFQAANTLVQWVHQKHSVPEVRQYAFRPQEILPTPPGDAQPNPPDELASIRIKVFRHREDEELPAVARLAWQYATQQPGDTIAILVPTHEIGHTLADHLDSLDADYDNLLHGSSREREVAAALHALLSLLADPLSGRALEAVYAALLELEHPAANGATNDEHRVIREQSPTYTPPPDTQRFYAILRSVHSPELLLFPAEATLFQQAPNVAFSADSSEPLGAEAPITNRVSEPAGAYRVAADLALPAGVAGPADLERLERFVPFLQRIFHLRLLPIDDLVLTLGDELFASPAHEADLAITYQIATLLRQWHDAQPEWRLPELVAQLADVAAGRRLLPIATAGDVGYEPQPGRITLATQHGAKGLEWDAVFLVGIDGFWIPGDLDAPFLGVQEFLGGDPTAEVVAQLRHLMEGDAGLYGNRTATESAHVDVICERLRLLYVGVTRARRHLHISRSKVGRQYNKERDAEPATVLGVLYDYLKKVKG
ncbi:MAG: ATP-dependent helicase [Chloroflexota bacterium]